MQEQVQRSPDCGDAFPVLVDVPLAGPLLRLRKHPRVAPDSREAQEHLRRWRRRHHPPSRLITRTGAWTGLVVTQSFPDTFLMMRGDVTRGLTEAEA